MPATVRRSSTGPARFSEPSAKHDPHIVVVDQERNCQSHPLSRGLAKSNWLDRLVLVRLVDCRSMPFARRFPLFGLILAVGLSATLASLVAAQVSSVAPE